MKNASALQINQKNLLSISWRNKNEPQNQYSKKDKTSSERRKNNVLGQDASSLMGSIAGIAELVKDSASERKKS